MHLSPQWIRLGRVAAASIVASPIGHLAAREHPHPRALGREAEPHGRRGSRASDSSGSPTGPRSRSRTGSSSTAARCGCTRISTEQIE